MTWIGWGLLDCLICVLRRHFFLSSRNISTPEREANTSPSGCAPVRWCPWSLGFMIVTKSHKHWWRANKAPCELMCYGEFKMWLNHIWISSIQVPSDDSCKSLSDFVSAPVLAGPSPSSPVASWLRGMAWWDLSPQHLVGQSHGRLSPIFSSDLWEGAECPESKSESSQTFAVFFQRLKSLWSRTVLPRKAVGWHDAPYLPLFFPSHTLQWD